MKSSIKLFFTAIVLISTTAFASAETRMLNKVATAGTIDRYIAAVTKGGTDNLTLLFSDDFNHQINNKGKVTVHNRAQVIGFLRGNKYLTQNCNTSYTLIEQNNNNAIAKVEMKYGEFTKVDYVTLINDGNRWKVSNVVSTYP